jgi:hypothetical protein
MIISFGGRAKILAGRGTLAGKKEKGLRLHVNNNIIMEPWPFLLSIICITKVLNGLEHSKESI